MHSHLKLGAQGLRLAMNLFYKMWEQCNICLAVFKLKLFSEGAGLHREARKAATWPTPHCSLSLKVTKCMKSRVSKPTVSHNILHACGKVNPKGGVSEVCPTAPPVAELGWAAWQLWVLTSPSGPAVVVRSGACATSLVPSFPTAWALPHICPRRRWGDSGGTGWHGQVLPLASCAAHAGLCCLWTCWECAIVYCSVALLSSLLRSQACVLAHAWSPAALRGWVSSEGVCQAWCRITNRQL